MCSSESGASGQPGHRTHPADVEIAVRQRADAFRPPSAPPRSAITLNAVPQPRPIMPAYAATCSAIALAPVATRADEHLAPASGTVKQAGIVHCSPRRGGLDDPRSPGNTAFEAVRQCGSGRSLGRDRQVNGVRGCDGLPGNSGLRHWCWSQRLRLLTSRSLLTTNGRMYPCALSRVAKPSRSYWSAKQGQ